MSVRDRQPCRLLPPMLLLSAVLPCAAAAEEPPDACGAPATPIHAVQGPGASSPLVGFADVVVEGVVVGDFRGFPTGLGGYFVQEEDAEVDADPRTSEGLFVFDDGDVRVGNTVRLRGEVREFFGLTELTRIHARSICPARGVASPRTLRLPVDDARQWERWEGMLVRFAQGLTITDAFDLGRFGELSLALGGRLWQPTQRAWPGAPARDWAERNARHRILLDDGSEAWRPDPPAYLSTAAGGHLRLGDRVVGLEGVVDFAWGDFRIQPTRPVRVESSTPRPGRPPRVGGTLRVAAWNVENYFNGNGRGGGFPTRGAAGPLELERQRAKLVATLAALDADVLALVELENDGAEPESAARELAEALSARVGTRWQLVAPGDGALGGHAIAVGLLFRPDRVEPTGSPAVLTDRAHAAFDSSRNRPSLAQTFLHRSTGERVTVAVNHFKSKGSTCPGDPDTGDGQGECSETRRRAAAALAAWLASDPTGAADAPVLIVGDLNAYPMEDAARELTDAGFVDLLVSVDGPGASTYVFDGAAGRLDHALASPALLPFVGGAGVWHVAADALPLLDYRLDNPAPLYTPDATRGSDHDPVLVGLFPDADGDGKVDARDACPHSRRAPTVSIGGCDTGVEERVDVRGCTLADELARLASEAMPPGKRLSAVARWLASRSADRPLTPRERAGILRCAASNGRARRSPRSVGAASDQGEVSSQPGTGRPLLRRNSGLKSLLW